MDEFLNNNHGIKTDLFSIVNTQHNAKRKKEKETINNLNGPKKNKLPINSNNRKKTLLKIGVAGVSSLLITTSLLGSTFPHVDLNPEYNNNSTVEAVLEDYETNKILSDIDIVQKFANTTLKNSTKEDSDKYYNALKQVKSNIPNLNTDIYKNIPQNNYDYNLIKATIIDTYLSKYSSTISSGDLSIYIQDAQDGAIIISVEKLGLSFSIKKKDSVVEKILSSQQEYYDSDNIDDNYKQIEEHINGLEKDLLKFKKILPKKAYRIKQDKIYLDSIDDVAIPETLTSNIESSSSTFIMDDYNKLNSQLGMNNDNENDLDK